jgi:phage shock protein B
MAFWTAVVTISLVSKIIFFIVLPVVIIFAVKSIKGGEQSKTKGMVDEETRMIQEIYQGLSKMEDRMEALETLLLEKERKEK